MLLDLRLDLTFGARSRRETSSWINFDYFHWQKRKIYTTSDAFLTLANKPGRNTLTGFVNNNEYSAVYSGGLNRPTINAPLFTLLLPRTYSVRADNYGVKLVLE